MISVSGKLTPQAWTAILTCVAPHAGAGSSVRTSLSGGPYSSHMTARIALLLRRHRAARRSRELPRFSGSRKLERRPARPRELAGRPSRISRRRAEHFDALEGDLSDARH